MYIGKSNLVSQLYFSEPYVLKDLKFNPWRQLGFSS